MPRLQMEHRITDAQTYHAYFESWEAARDWLEEHPAPGAYIERYVAPFGWVLNNFGEVDED